MNYTNFYKYFIFFVIIFCITAGRTDFTHARTPDKKTYTKLDKNYDYYHNISGARMTDKYESIKNAFDELKLKKYRNKFIFAAITDIKNGRIIFTSSRDFYFKNKIRPGSIIKIFDYALILKNIKNAEENIYFCRDQIFHNDVLYNCSQKGGHGELNLERAFYLSCNLYFQNYMRKIPRIKFCRALKKCGFINDTVEQKILNATTEKYSQIVIGDGDITVTPEKLIELVRFFAAGGAAAGPASSCYHELFYTAIEKINAAMRLTALRGTAAETLRGLDCAAKTGSATIISKIENGKKIILTSAIFIGYAPYVSPEYAIMTFCETGMGGADGAYIARRLLEAVNVTVIK